MRAGIGSGLWLDKPPYNRPVEELLTTPHNNGKVEIVTVRLLSAEGLNRQAFRASHHAMTTSFATARQGGYANEGPALRRMSLAMAAGIMGRLGSLALAIVVGRSFGAEDFGAFTFATGLALVVGQLAALGWPALMNRLIPKFREEQDWSALGVCCEAEH